MTGSGQRPRRLGPSPASAACRGSADGLLRASIFGAHRVGGFKRVGKACAGVWASHAIATTCRRFGVSWSALDFSARRAFRLIFGRQGSNNYWKRVPDFGRTTWAYARARRTSVRAIDAALTAMGAALSVLRHFSMQARSRGQL